MNLTLSSSALLCSGVLNKITSSSEIAQQTFKWAMHVAEERRNALDNAQRSAVLAVQWNLAQQLVFNQIKAVKSALAGSILETLNFDSAHCPPFPLFIQCSASAAGWNTP